MTIWFIIIGLIYVGTLGYCAHQGHQLNKASDQDYVTAGSQLGPILGFLTFSATLFSTFTLMGMPDFFRNHGIGAWIFLGVTDVALAFSALWIGLYFRKYIREHGFQSIAKLLKSAYGTSFAAWVYLAGIFIFLLPYVSIQIRGIALFLEVAMPFNLPLALWSVLLLTFLMVYSGIGGLRAIIYSDALQGVLLLCVSWIMAATCYRLLGSDLAVVFTKVGSANQDLLSTPGPKGLFTVQFLLASFLAIIFMPISQPQLTIRLAVLKSDSTLRVMAIAIALFSFLVILPTIMIGAYGAVFLADQPAPVFWKAVMIDNQLPFFAALTAVGLIAAAMSTADSQIFALGTEYGSLHRGENTKSYTKLISFLFALSALALSILSTSELVLLARVTFAGTALLAPMILLPIAISAKVQAGNSTPLNSFLPTLTAISLVVFLLSLLGVLSPNVAGLRLDLLLLIMLFSLSIYIYRNKSLGRSDLS